MYQRRVDDNDPNLYNPVRAHTGSQSAYQHETFSMNCAMHDFGQDLYENFYVKAWVWLDPAKERLVNVQRPCEDGDFFITSGTVTASGDGGQIIPNAGAKTCMLSDPFIEDSHNYFHGYPTARPKPGSGVSCPLNHRTSARGKRWDVYSATSRQARLACRPPHGYNSG